MFRGTACFSFDQVVSDSNGRPCDVALIHAFVCSLCANLLQAMPCKCVQSPSFAGRLAGTGRFASGTAAGASVAGAASALFL